MSVRYLTTADAPEAIGPYSQATVVGGFLFTAGQIAFDPKTMQVVEGDAAAQAEQVMKNLTAVLSNAGCSWAEVAKTTMVAEIVAVVAGEDDHRLLHQAALVEEAPEPAEMIVHALRPRETAPPALSAGKDRPHCRSG